jgi:GntR family transcriptional regulator, transcriptional repressor for pyruvate dehydrogenase complex
VADRKVPVYRRIAEQLRSRLLAGDPAPGDPFPAATALAAAFGVSTAPVHRAFGVLEREGLVDVRPGSGVYVLPHPDPHRSRDGEGDPDLARVLAAVRELREHLDERIGRVEQELAALRARLEGGG